MGLIDKKIIEGDYTGKDISELPDKPSQSGISAATLKARFDSLTKNLTVVNFNALIDELIAVTSAAQLGGSTFDGIPGTNIQTLLENLKIYTDGELSSRDSVVGGLITGLNNLSIALSTLKLTELSDTPNSYAGSKGKVLTVNELENGIDFAATSSGIIPANDISVVDGGSYYVGDRVEAVLQEIGLALSTISLSFIGLTDTPPTYTGQAGKFPKVNVLETGLEFVDVSGLAQDIEITDTNNYYTSTDVEGALGEIGSGILTLEDDAIGVPPTIDADTLDGSTLAEVLLAIYPVGSIYLSVVNTNPSTLFGGTWVAFGTGRTLVGVDTGQTEFDTVEETGGYKTHTLSIDEMPEHNHNVYVGNTGTGYRAITESGVADSSLGSTVLNKGGSQPHNNLQPYITTYMWKRTV